MNQSDTGAYLQTLGDVGFFSAGSWPEGRPVLGAGKPLAVLAFLAHLPNRKATRDQLIDLLWSDRSLEAARHALRQTVWLIRKHHGSWLLAADKRHVTLSRSVGCDRDDFIAAVERVDLETAVEVYRGHYLERIGSPGGVEFDHWVDAERYRLALLLRRTAEVAIRARLAEGATRRALQIAESVRRLEPANQTLARLVIEAQLADGEIVAARVESEALTETLRRIGRPAEPATKHVLTLASRCEPSETPSDHPGDLVGRAKELRTLQSAALATENGEQRIVHVAGPAGMGRTRLLTAFHRQRQSAGSASVLIRGPANHPTIPYSAASDLVGALGACRGALGVSPQSVSVLLSLNPALSAHFRGTPDHGPADERLRHRVAAVAELVAAVAHESPLALLLDDFDTYDGPSQQLLAAVGAHIWDHPVLIVTSGAGHTPPLKETTRSIRLTRLPVEDIHRFLGIAAPVDAEVLHALERATDGSPGQLTEVVERLEEDGVLERSETGWRLTVPSAAVLSALSPPDETPTDRDPRAPTPRFGGGSAMLVLAGVLIGLLIGLAL